jgi:hypothetical protein
MMKTRSKPCKQKTPVNEGEARDSRLGFHRGSGRDQYGPPSNKARVIASEAKQSRRTERSVDKNRLLRFARNDTLYRSE